VFDALVEEIGSWWISVEAECIPVVLGAKKPNEVKWSSPFTRWPDDRIVFRMSADASAGTLLKLQHEGDNTLQAMDERALRHRWGQHLDMDLREFVDEGWPTDAYRYTPYRVDLEDWSVSDRIHEEQRWRVDTDLWASIALDPESGWGAPTRMPASCRIIALGDRAEAPPNGDLLRGPRASRA
jgi:hypothetical protein